MTAKLYIYIREETDREIDRERRKKWGRKIEKKRKIMSDRNKIKQEAKERSKKIILLKKLYPT